MTVTGELKIHRESDDKVFDIIRFVHGDYRGEISAPILEGGIWFGPSAPSGINAGQVNRVVSPLKNDPVVGEQPDASLVQGLGHDLRTFAMIVITQDGKCSCSRI